MNEGWKSQSAHCGQATRLLRCQCLHCFTNRWVPDAGRLGDPAGHMSLESCPALLCFVLATLSRSCLCSGWHWHLFLKELGFSLPAERTHPVWGTHSPGERQSDGGRCPQAHPKQKDVPPCPTPLLCCCRSLEKDLGEGGRVCLGAEKQDQDWVRRSLGRPQRYPGKGCPWQGAARGAPPQVARCGGDRQGRQWEAEESVTKER